VVMNLAVVPLLIVVLALIARFRRRADVGLS
jgi:hypothetical protein